MGCCVVKKKGKTERRSLMISISQAINPAVFIVENFKIVDQTSSLKDMQDISEIKKHFSDYKAVDFRCIKGSREGKHDHSHLIVLFNQMIHGEVISELAMIVNYSLYGFGITIGNVDDITKDCDLARANIEFLHLPKADNEEKIGISDIIEWSYEHKDEKYMDPHKIPEFNMGKRIYFHFVSLLSHSTRYRV
ncbi:hypothetical protein SteCoe_16200 [Stentor coeruleus]|uniref:Uncharacterized protein n=1 Tax=Stentor coeruleus TaxID=5963 RepID=A0A1R2C1T8_9CILI|nr:hypothetical protein SteCoe_16200 [Stentor coeruleus]